MGKKLCNTLLQFFYREKQDRILVAKSSSFLWRAVSEINSNFFVRKIFFDVASSCFYRHETFLCYINFFFVDMKYFSVQHQHVSVKTKLLLVQCQTFYSNTKLFSVQHQIFGFGIIFVMSW